MQGISNSSKCWTHIWDGTSERWTELATMRQGRRNPTLVSLNNKVSSILYYFVSCPNLTIKAGADAINISELLV